MKIYMYDVMVCRDIVRNAVGASEHDAVIFTGSGCTGAVHKLIQALHLSEPPVSWTLNLYNCALLICPDLFLGVNLVGCNVLVCMDAM